MTAMTEREPDTIVMTEAQKKARRGRSIAIALALVGFVVVMYFLTLVRMGPAILDRGGF